MSVEVEEWKNIEDFPEYEVSDWGRIRKGNKEIHSRKNRLGMLVISLRKDKRYGKTVAILVLEAFIGRLGKYCIYKDQNFDNVNLSNLEWKSKVIYNNDPIIYSKLIDLTEENLLKEQWKPVENFEDYEISNMGRIRRYYQNRIIYNKIYFPSRKYCTIELYRNGYKNTSVGIHKLVLNAFVGPCPEGMECRHLDGNPWNNKVDNLKWGTHLENAMDTIRLGRQAFGDKHPNAKLIDTQIEEIKQILNNFKGKKVVGLRKGLAIKYNVSIALINRIATNRHRVKG